MVGLWDLKTCGISKKEIRPQKISRDATQNKAVCESCRDPFLAGEHSPAKDDLLIAEKGKIEIRKHHLLPRLILLEVVQENLEHSHVKGVHHHHLAEAEHYLQMQNYL